MSSKSFRKVVSKHFWFFFSKSFFSKNVQICQLLLQVRGHVFF